MNMLVIGNGFDLALGLPTRYVDFLNFIKIFGFIYNDDCCTNGCSVLECLNKAKNSLSALQDEKSRKELTELNNFFMRFEKAFTCNVANKAFRDFHFCVHDNRWIEYFQNRYEKNLIEGENWIDLEKEVKEVITLLENDSFEVEKRRAEDFELDKACEKIENITNIILKEKNNKRRYRIPTEAYVKLRKNLRNEFDRFIMALGIYLDFFVKYFDAEDKISKDIYLMGNDSDKKIDHVLSFNYINNYNRKYASIPQKDDNTCYVHGEIHYKDEINKCISQQLPIDDNTLPIEKLIEKNNMIIGFDEYMEDGRKNDQLDFVYYRKYFQRISKGTGSQYLEWLDGYKAEIHKMTVSSSSNDSQNVIYDKLISDRAKKKPNHIFIFGHSLDATDKDIFCDLLLREPNDTKVTIFYHDEDAHDRIIINLIRILSQEILIKKTHGSDPDIELVKQSDWTP